MKKLLVLAVIALSAVLSVNAQDDWKNEISISYGFGAFTDLSSSYLGGIFMGKQSKYIGPFGVEYFYRPKSALGVGLVGTFATCKFSDTKDSRTKYFSIMPAVKYNWLNRDHCSLYSKVALGVLLGRESDGYKKNTKAAFVWQVSAVGAEFGNAIRGFVEAGFGEQGILVLGLRCKF